MKELNLTSISREWMTFLFPSVCMVCGHLLVVGDNCSEQLKELQICVRCLSTFPVRLEKERWFPCLSNPYETDPIPDFKVWTMLHYRMPVTMLLRRMKFHSAQYCGTLIGTLMGREFPKDLPVTWQAVIPIPLSEKRRETRGFNQAEVLGEKLAEAISVPMLPEVLVRTRHTSQQSRFQDPLQRDSNVSGAFAVESSWDISGWNILLLDDILTSGATLHEAARVLYQAGAALVVGVAAATHRERIEKAH